MMCDMNSTPHRKTYGTLPLSPALVRAVQLEWAMVERPSPDARFLNFPLVDDASVATATRPTRKAKRLLAA